MRILFLFFIYIIFNVYPRSSQYYSATLTSICFSATRPAIYPYLLYLTDSAYYLALFLALGELYPPASNLYIETQNFLGILFFFVTFFPPLLYHFQHLLSTTHFCIFFNMTVLSGSIAISFTSNSANHFLFSHLYYSILILYKFFLRTGYDIFYFWHLASKCRINCRLSPHHQHSGKSSITIHSKNISIVPCLVLSW